MRLLVFTICLFLASVCATAAPRQALEESVAQSYAALVQVENTTEQALSLQEITPEVARKVALSVLNIRGVLADAQAAIDTKDRASAITLTAQAKQAVTSLKRYVAKQQAAQPRACQAAPPLTAFFCTQ